MNLKQVSLQVERKLNKMFSMEYGTDARDDLSREIMYICDGLSEQGIGGILVNGKFLSTETYQFEG